MKVRRIDFSPDEWIAGTVGMSLEEEGLYIRICALIYSRGRPIDEDDLKGSSDHGNKLNALLRKLESRGKIVRNGREIDQKRCRNELEKAEKRTRKLRENGSKSRRNKDLAEPNGLHPTRACVPSTINHQPSTIIDSEAKASAADAAPELPFDPIKDLWDRGKAVLGNSKNAGSLIGKWRRDFGDTAVMSAIIAAEREGAIEPVEFLIGCLRKESVNGRGHKQTPVEKLWDGANRAARAWAERERIRGATDGPLLDGGRSSGSSASAD